MTASITISKNTEMRGLYFGLSVNVNNGNED